jgi:hypothetical protein
MPRFTVRCTACGLEEDQFLKGGDHPPCRGCNAVTDYVWRATGASHGIVTDEAFIGGLVIENLGDQPVTVYSRADLARRMQEARVEQRIKYVPGDKHLTDWSKAIDPYTLEAARALVSRPGALDRPDPPPSLRVETSIKTIPHAPQSPAPDQLDN